jgi:hypothetical protein
MQPPTSSTYLRDRIAQLKMEAEIRNNNLLPVGVAFNPIEQYSQKINSWIHTLPISQQERKYSIEEIISLVGLKGQTTEFPSLSDIATALRNANFIQVRSWKKADRSKRFWVFKGPSQNKNLKS